MRISELSAWYGSNQALYEVSLDIPQGAVTAVIGPSGCGKSTFLRCLNRLHEEVPRARCTGQIFLDGEDIFREDPGELRCRVGMVFQKPTPFPNLSVYDNVATGLRLLGVRQRTEMDRAVVRSLQRVALWDEVKHNVDLPGSSLSGGQQQRLCIARALAMQPEVLLMDEPCSALDPIATAKVERLITDLKASYTVVLVTHNLQQAHRVADFVAFFYLGKLVEFGRADALFAQPREKLTENYLTGRFG